MHLTVLTCVYVKLNYYNIIIFLRIRVKKNLLSKVCPISVHNFPENLNLRLYRWDLQMDPVSICRRTLEIHNLKISLANPRRDGLKCSLTIAVFMWTGIICQNSFGSTAEIAGDISQCRPQNRTR